MYKNEFFIIIYFIMDIQDISHIQHILQSIPHITKTELGYTANQSMFIECMWKDNIGFHIQPNDLPYYNHFVDYFAVINMLELNGVSVHSLFYPTICFCFNHYNCKHSYGSNKIGHMLETCKKVCTCTNRIVFDMRFKTLYYNKVRYICSYENIREELKDVLRDFCFARKRVAHFVAGLAQQQNVQHSLVSGLAQTQIP